MGMFDGMATDTSVVEDKDFVKGKGFEPIPSGIYELAIKYAYAAKSKGGAMGINLVFTTPDGTEVKDQQWVTSGDAKGNKNFWIRKGKDKDGNPLPDTKHYLPGFSAVNNLVNLATGKELADIGTEVKNIKLYDFESKADKATDVDMIMDLVGQKVAAAILYQVVDRTSKNESTGKYEPNGKTRRVNTIEKYLQTETHKTVQEIRGGVEDATYQKDWLEKWQGEIDDTSTKTANPATTGAPAASGGLAPKSGLFA